MKSVFLYKKSEGLWRGTSVTHLGISLKNDNQFDLRLLALIFIPLIIALGVLFSSLAFAPVPWPDDSAFYFVAKELFKWPPRWVMLPQAPFEPTYKIFNFNTMPLYPVLIGLGRWIGIDGSHLLKIWPLGAWAASGSLLGVVLYRKGLPFTLALLMVLVFLLDPEGRWASVLVRPESLVGLFGMALVLGLSLGFPARASPTCFWDPVAALLALGAYSHFNAVHLVLPVLFTFIRTPQRLFQIGWKTALYLSPWLLAVLYHWKIFLAQMDTQWFRLSFPNPWLSSVSTAVSSLFQDMGNPIPWPPIVQGVAGVMWALFGISVLCVLRWRGFAPTVGWVIGALWIWHSKPEVWFMYYPHVAIWCFLGVALLKLWKFRFRIKSHLRVAAIAVITTFLIGIVCIFGYVDISQAIDLEKSQSWHWSVYYDFIDCIERQLVSLEKSLPAGHAFRVWDPTFPDVTIELSRRHPHWEFTRTNDFMNRIPLAIRHGWETEAVVVTETLSWAERNVSEKAEKVSEIQSAWMHWKPYFLNRLYTARGWKPNRYVCQRGRWQAFLFMNDPEKFQSDLHNHP